jgi:hypothetical protein
VRSNKRHLTIFELKVGGGMMGPCFKVFRYTFGEPEKSAVFVMVIDIARESNKIYINASKTRYCELKMIKLERNFSIIIMKDFHPWRQLRNQIRDFSIMSFQSYMLSNETLKPMFISISHD